MAVLNWYPKLYEDPKHPDKPFLFRDYPKEEINPPQVLLSYTLPGETNRYFRLTNSPRNLCEYLATVPSERHHFFEVIFGHWKQKPHFDIDGIEGEGKTSEQLETIAAMIREEIAHQLSLLGVKPTELRWYSSNSDIKKSLHLVIPNYYFENNKAAFRLWQYLTERLPSGPKGYQKYVDGAVYSSLQNFRLLGSCKPAKPGFSPRTKILMPSWIFSGERIEIPRKDGLTELKESLVSYVSKNARPFPVFEIVRKSRDVNYQPGDFPAVLQEEINQLVIERLNNTVQYYRTNGSIISYKRIMPGYCEFCSPYKPDHDKEHENDNPFVTVIWRANKWEVYLHCHRAKYYVKNERKRFRNIASYSPEEDWMKVKEQTEEWSTI
jgi:hypothetical protein